MILGSKVLSQIVCTLMFFIIFLVLFYFYYIEIKEKHVLKKQIDFLIDNTIGPSVYYICQENGDNNKQFCSNLKNSVQNMNPESPENVKEDLIIEKNNKLIKKKSLKTLAIAVVICIAIISLLYYFSNNNNKGSFFKDFSLKNVVKNSFIIISFAAVTEFLFFEFFASRAIFVDQNFIKERIIKKLNTLKTI